jgi:hypothetical protein
VASLAHARAVKSWAPLSLLVWPWVMVAGSLSPVRFVASADCLACEAMGYRACDTCGGVVFRPVPGAADICGGCVVLLVRDATVPRKTGAPKVG